MMTKIWDLAYSVDGDAINVEQDSGGGETHMVTLHPIHLRLLASEAGILRGDADAWAKLEAMERRLLKLHHRVKTLDEWLAADVGKDAPDLALHATFSEATLAILDEWCSEIPAFTEAQEEPRANPAGTHREQKQSPTVKGGADQPGLPGLEVQQ